MKILVVCQYYYPEPFRISDICEELVRRGHEVTIVTGIPNYPEGEIYKDYKNKRKRSEIHNGVKIYRCTTIPRKTGVVYRFLNYYSFALSSTRFINQLNEDFDIVLVNQLSPVMMARAGLRYSKKHKKPVVLYCLDLWPQSLVSGGIKKGSLIYRYYHGVSERIYKKADRILVTSKSFFSYFDNEFNIGKDKVSYIPQYAEDLFSKVKQKEEKDNEGIFNFVFAGNIGTAQSVITIVKTAQLLRDEPVLFHIIGSGIELESLVKYADDNELKNIIFYGRRPIEEMPGFYSKADAMLLTLESDPVISMTLPGKVQSYMKAGKPIIGAINGEARMIIEEANCGFCGSAEDINELADNILKFIKCEDRELFANNAKKYYNEHFSKSIFMDRFIKILDLNKGVKK